MRVWKIILLVLIWLLIVWAFMAIGYYWGYTYGNHDGFYEGVEAQAKCMFDLRLQ